MNELSRESTWRAHAEVWLWRHGWIWPAVVALSAVAACLQFAVLVPANEALTEARAQLALSRQWRVHPAASTPEAYEVQQLEQLRAALRSNADALVLLRRLGELAQEERIALGQGEYQHQAHAATGLQQVQLTQPVKASYPQVKHYIESVLRAVPNISLDQISVRRDNVGQAEPEVRLRWSIWIEPPQPKPADRATGKAHEPAFR